MADNSIENSIAFWDDTSSGTSPDVMKWSLYLFLPTTGDYIRYPLAYEKLRVLLAHVVCVNIPAE
jgi:hypothetical protein